MFLEARVSGDGAGGPSEPGGPQPNCAAAGDTGSEGCFPRPHRTGTRSLSSHSEPTRSPPRASSPPGSQLGPAGLPDIRGTQARAPVTGPPSPLITPVPLSGNAVLPRDPPSSAASRTVGRVVRPPQGGLESLRSHHSVAFTVTPAPALFCHRWAPTTSACLHACLPTSPRDRAAREGPRARGSGPPSSPQTLGGPPSGDPPERNPEGE